MSTNPSHRRLGVRAEHRVTPQDVRRRVSVRHRPPEHPGTVTDVVGRLLAYEREVLSIVDRHGQHHLVATAAVVASKVVPEHPRRPAEPADLGTRDRPLPRDAARVVLLDDADRVLLVAHRPTPQRRVWTAPGGGVAVGESHEDAAARELREEVGVDLTVGPWVWSRRAVFPYAGTWIDQRERWFLVRVDRLDASSAPLRDTGIDEARWWSVAQLRGADDELAPQLLADHLAGLLRDGPPPTPVEVGR